MSKKLQILQALTTRCSTQCQEFKYLWQKYILKRFPSKHKAKFRLQESFTEMCMYLLHLRLYQMKGFHFPCSIEVVTSRSVVIWRYVNSPRCIKTTQSLIKKCSMKWCSARLKRWWWPHKWTTAFAGQGAFKWRGRKTNTPWHSLWPCKLLKQDKRRQVTTRQRKDEGDIKKKGEFLE